ncbi:NAC transcription factor ONAC010 [Apostasia shenzhenica]|uniref:NAC transcription factor ONAC010 n=1 Tax=Apostasia shenzhenica TaxID=1088818 RepID=A0A2I0AI87_9ASPA|nr:NAC transcription factor ONAC010 [Apostasia shenzhenica]
MKPSMEIKLPPGFRFRPTDEEILIQYLRRKAFSSPLPAAIISELDDLRKYHPHDLTGGFGGERYFFNLREANERRRSTINLSTSCLGYWKAVGKEKMVVSSSRRELLGMVQALVFHGGKDFNGFHTEWFMHEYRLATNGDKLVASGKEWIVCRIFAKRRGLKKKKKAKEIQTSPSSSGSSSCISCLSYEEESQNGEEAMSKLAASSAPQL